MYNNINGQGNDQHQGYIPEGIPQQEPVKVVRKKGEESKVALRAIRRDANEQIKKQRKNSDMKKRLEIFNASVLSFSHSSLFDKKPHSTITAG